MKISTMVILSGIICAVCACSVMMFRGKDEQNLDLHTKEAITETDSDKGIFLTVPDTKVQKIPKTPSVNIGMPYDFSTSLHGDPTTMPLTKLCASGILVDVSNRKVLWEKNAQAPVYIASMTKIMSAYLIYEALENRDDISYDTLIPVSVSSSKIGGSQAYLDPRESFTIRELLKAIIIHSSNDCTELMAEFLCDGNAQDFVSKMNEKARFMGLKNTTFYSAHGLPPGRTTYWKRDNLGSVEDIALLSEYLIQYDDALVLSKTDSFIFRPNAPKPNKFDNTNFRLLRYCQGCDGLKTGFTQKAKFCVSATCKRNGRRMICVVSGVEHGNSKRDDRAKLVRYLFDWGYAQAPGTPPKAPAATVKQQSKTSSKVLTPTTKVKRKKR